MSSVRTLPSALAGLVILAFPAVAQVDLSWFHQIDTANQQIDYVRDFALAPNGTVVSIVTRPYPGNAPGVLLAHAANGVQVWSTTWSLGADPVQVRDLAIEPTSGDVFVCGVSNAFNGPHLVPGSGNIAVARFSASGAKLWERSWDGPNQLNDHATHIAFGANRIVVVGMTHDGNGPDFVAVSYDADGTLLWSYTIAWTASSLMGAEGVQIAPGGDAVAIGYAGGPIPDIDIFVVRLDPNGVERWLRTLDGGFGGVDRAYGLALDSASSVYVGGVVSGPSNPQNPTDAVIAKWDVNGVPQWSRIGPALHPGAFILGRLAVDGNDNLYACGYSVDVATGLDALLMKLDSSGQTLWQRSYVGEGERLDAFSAIAVDPLGGVVVGGTTGIRYPSLQDERDALVIRYDADGTERWQHRGLFSYPNSDGAFDVALGANGSVVYVGDTSYTVGGSSDVLIVKLVEQSSPFCFGDGSGTACPCGNESAPGEGSGCRSSLGIGARIYDLGDASRFSDSLELHAIGVTNAPVLFYQGAARLNGGLGNPFGDGLLCVGGGIRRIGTVPASGGAASYPPPGGVPVSIRGFVQQGTTYHYQARYRNSAAFCTSATFNQTNGLSILWSI